MAGVEDAFGRIIHLALQREVEAQNFYSGAAENAQLSSSAKLLHELAEEEVTHRQRLEKALEEGVCKTFSCRTVAEVDDLKLTDYLVEIPLSTDSSPQEVLQVAMKREQASHHFYKALCEQTRDATFRTVFGALAKEELDHKNRLEKMYEDHFLPEM